MAESATQKQDVALQRSLIAIKTLRSRLEAIESQRTEPIAIIGMSCRLPGGANSPEEFWRILCDGVDGISEVPPDRWDIDAFYDPDPDAPGKMYTRWGGFLDQVDQFDPQFFGITSREAVGMDPQQRLLLEVTWEALENAGQAPDRLKGSQTGVFVGISSTDYATLSIQAGLPNRIDAYSGTGGVNSVAAGRISYLLGLRGPNFPIDTACSSSLVALHEACQSLRHGETDMAIVGGVNVLLLPEGTIYFCKLQAMSPDGRCKTFDASADGYVRGEGCGVVILKRLSDARRNRDHVLALIRGSAVNHDGRSNGLTAPSGEAQETVIKQALASGGVQPQNIDYVETHGTGTALGDPVEMQALAGALGAASERRSPLVLGSGKSNIGHLEAAAGIAGVIKTVLVLQHRKAPPVLHFRTPNPHIPWDAMPMVVPTELTPWPNERSSMVAGVSSFGFSGTNAHAVLERPCEPESARHAEDGPDRPRHILTLSARTPTALRTAVSRLAAHVQECPDDALADVCFSANTGRSHFAHRVAVTARSRQELQARLDDLTSGEDSVGSVSDQPPKVAFVFPPTEDFALGMGRDLYQTQPTFRSRLDECDELFAPFLSTGVSALVRGDNGDLALQAQPMAAEAAAFGVQIALAQLWIAWGVRPSMVLGQGGGAIAAACTAGSFSLPDAVTLLIEHHTLRGALNGTDALSAAQDAFDRATANLAYKRPTLGVISDLSGGLAEADDTACSGYWRRHAVSTGPVANGLRAVHDAGIRVVLRLGPAEDALGTMDPVQEGVLSLGSVHAERSDWDTILESLAHLYHRGAPIAWDVFDQDYARRRRPLPTTPFGRTRHWAHVPISEADSRASESDGPSHPLLGRRIPSPLPDAMFQSLLREDSPAFLSEHRVFGASVMPATAFLEMSLAAWDQVGGGVPVVMEDVALLEPAILGAGQQRLMHVTVAADSNAGSTFRVFSVALQDSHEASSWREHVTGRMLRAQSAVEPEPGDLDQARARCAAEVPVDRFYRRIAERGFEYGPMFRGVRLLRTGSHESLSRIEFSGPLPDMEAYVVHPALLDACLQTVAATVNAEIRSAEADVTYLPFRLSRFCLHQRPGSTLWCHAALASQSPVEEGITTRLSIFNEDGEPCMTIDGLQFRKASRQGLKRVAASRMRDQYRLVWKPVAAPVRGKSGADAETDACYWILPDGRGAANALAPQLHREGCTLIVSKDPQSVKGVDLRGIVDLTSLDVDFAHRSAGWRSALRLVQAIAGTASARVPRLVLVTSGATSAGGITSADGVHQASVWGLGSVIALEHPVLRTVRLDLDPTASIDESVEVLVPEILARDAEDRVAWRGGQRHGLRLERHTESREDSAADAVRADGAYLVTGGTGSLGMRVAERLVARGARHLVLAARSEAGAERLRAIDGMRDRGANVDVVACDVSDASQVAAMVGGIEANRRLRGVVHAAGALDDGVLLGQSVERFESVLASKALGGWNLHTATRGLDLDFFVLFSSMASVLGAPGQGNYAAANASLDALAQWRRCEGLPALSINWGPWEDSGMVNSSGGGMRQRWSAMGVRLLSPERGLDAFEALLSDQGEAQVMVADIDWKRLSRSLDASLAPPLLSDWIVAATDGSAWNRSDVVERLRAAPLPKRRELLVAHLREQVGKSLGLAAGQTVNARQSLLEMGMDSLMATELRNRVQSDLGEPIPPTLVFDYPTVEAIADHLLSDILRLDRGPPKDEAPPPERHEGDPAVDDIRSLSEEELARSIAEELSLIGPDEDGGGGSHE